MNDYIMVILSTRVRIHATAQLGEHISLGENIRIEAGVQIGDGCIIEDNTFIGKNTIIGDNCHLYTGAIVGSAPQDISYKDESSRVIIGNDVQIREYVTINRGTGEGSETRLGNGCLLMAYSHVGHNGVLGQEVILANSVQLGGYAQVGDYANIGGLVAVHQFVRVGRFVMMSGFSATRQDIPPFTLTDGRLASVRGINRIGLKRRGVSLGTRSAIKEAYKLLLFKGLPQSIAIAQIQEAYPEEPLMAEITQFFLSSKRGIRRSYGHHEEFQTDS